MTILAYCGEDCDTQSLLSVTWSTTATYFRSGYARGTLVVNAATVASDPPGSRFRTSDFTSASSEFWVSWRMYRNNATATANAQWVRILDSSGVCRLIIRATSTPELKISTRNAAATITDLATSSGWANPIGSIVKYDLYVKYANDGTGVVTLYEDGEQVLTYSGANTTDGATALASVEFAGFLATATYNYSEVIVSTTDTRSMGLVLLNSTTAGAAQDWDGTATNVNQNSLVNEAQYIYTATANEFQQYKPASLPAGNFNVEAVGMSARALRGASGPQKFDFATRIGSTNYVSSDVTLTTAFVNYVNIQSTNPGTTTGWVKGDLVDTNFQYGVKSIT